MSYTNKLQMHFKVNVGRGRTPVYVNGNGTELRNHEDHLFQASQALETYSVSVV